MKRMLYLLGRHLQLTHKSIGSGTSTHKGDCCSHCTSKRSAIANPLRLGVIATFATPCDGKPDTGHKTLCPVSIIRHIAVHSDMTTCVVSSPCHTGIPLSSSQRAASKPDSWSRVLLLLEVHSRNARISRRKQHTDNNDHTGRPPWIHLRPCRSSNPWFLLGVARYYVCGSL